MAEDHIEGYLRWITPVLGDPTYSLLKAHLLFEELIRAYLARTLPHASALQGSRLTFTQLLAVARASSTHVGPDHWVWQAISELNRLRNTLSHESRPKDIAKRFQAYVKLVVDGTKVQLPAPASRRPASTGQHAGHTYTAADMVTLGLYYYTASLLGFDANTLGEREEARVQTLLKSLAPGKAGNAG